MGKITCFIPYLEVGTIIQEIIREIDENPWELEILLANYASDVAGWKNENTDVIIARGITASAARKLVADIPVIDLQVSGYDFLRAVHECRKDYPEAKIAVVGSPAMLYGVKSIEDIMGVELEVIEVADETEAEPRILKLKNAGFSVIIGGVMSTLIAKRCGMNSVFIRTGREAIYHGLREAVRAAQIRRKEQERSEQFRAILDYSVEGVVAVDATGCINLVNAAATRQAGLRADAVGRQAEKLLPQLAFARVLKNGAALLGEIESINGQAMAVNTVPIKIGPQTVGAVATFQPVAAIQELEGRLRRKIYRRGLVAKHVFADIVGQSAAIRRAIDVAREYSELDSNILIMGETGTGKEIFAQSIHNGGGRGQGPFVAVNCAALPESLLESELFGYVEGAFSGASRGGKIGLFELAHRGTILLDEISEISPKLQGRLLRVLQEREIMRLGDDRVIPVDVRIIAATNRDLQKMMREGLFREDIYYRLDILRLVLPPLRERREDIIALLHVFLERQNRRVMKPVKEIGPEAQAQLQRYEWPGNVRELRNVAERLAAIRRSEVIEGQDIEEMLSRSSSSTEARGDGLHANREAVSSARLRGSLDQTVLLKALEESNYHYAKAAAALGISRTTLWRRLKETAAAK